MSASYHIYFRVAIFFYYQSVVPHSYNSLIPFHLPVILSVLHGLIIVIFLLHIFTWKEITQMLRLKRRQKGILAFTSVNVRTIGFPVFALSCFSRYDTRSQHLVEAFHFFQGSSVSDSFSDSSCFLCRCSTLIQKFTICSLLEIICIYQLELCFPLQQKETCSSVQSLWPTPFLSLIWINLVQLLFPKKIL